MISQKDGSSGGTNSPVRYWKRKGARIIICRAPYLNLFFFGNFLNHKVRYRFAIKNRTKIPTAIKGIVALPFYVFFPAL